MFGKRPTRKGLNLIFWPQTSQSQAQKKTPGGVFFFGIWWSRGDLNPQPGLNSQGLQRNCCHKAVISPLVIIQSADSPVGLLLMSRFGRKRETYLTIPYHSA